MELCHPQPHPRRPISNPLQALAYTQPILMLHHARTYYGLTTDDSLHTLHRDAASGVALAHAYPQRHVREFRTVYENWMEPTESPLASGGTWQVEKVVLIQCPLEALVTLIIAGCRRIYVRSPTTRNVFRPYRGLFCERRRVSGQHCLVRAISLTCRACSTTLAMSYPF